MRVRFAPSPTGYLHIGNVHTAVFTWLFARQGDGTFVLRIEDTDTDRSSAAYEAAILEELRWLGMDWDEGVDVGGPHGPYRQSERLDIYREYAQKLLESGHAYYCFCSRDEVDAMRHSALERGEMPKYSGHCRDLSPQEAARRIARGEKPVLRFRLPALPRTIVVDDLIRGPIEFSSDALDDFVLVRSNGVPLYNFAVTVDDMTMRISHIVRADEHISNTPRQVLVYEALGLTPPRFAHVSMLLGPDRTKLSKRHGAAAIGEFREQGFLPEALFNYLATLGWAPVSGKELMSREELIREFDLTRVSRSAAIFDLEKLKWLNGQYIRNADLDYLAQLALPYLRQKGWLPPAVDEKTRRWVRDLVGVLRGYLDRLGQLPEYSELFFSEDYEPEGEKERRVLDGAEVPEVLRLFLGRLDGLSRFEPDAIHEALHAIPSEMHIPIGKALRPLRVALTGKLSGPELHNVVWLFGRGKCRERAEETLARISGTHGTITHGTTR